MMILKKKKVKLENEDNKTRRKSNSNSGIYLTAVKVAQCRQVAVNRREIGIGEKDNSKEEIHKKGSSPNQEV